MERSLQEDLAWLSERLEEVTLDACRETLDRIRGVLAGADGPPRLESLDADAIRAVLKHLTTWFHLRNKAEQVHIVRVNRERERSATPESPRAESLADAVKQARDRGCSADQLRSMIERLDIRPTLTAHPTEARRRSILEKQGRIAELLIEQDRREPTPRERDVLDSEARQTLRLLMVTDEVRARRLDVMDEVRNGVHYLASTIWDAVPELVRDLSDAVRERYGEHAEVPVPIRYRSWIGGDRDGNPLVTAERTQEALRTMREAAIARHRATLEGLYRELSLSDRRVPILAELVEAVWRDADACEIDPPTAQHLAHEPLRIRVLQLIAKLGDDSYRAGAFVADLRLLRAALEHAGLDEAATRGRLADAIVRAEAFGFHLAAIDIRQHSKRHESAIGEMLAVAGVEADYAALSETERVAVLRRELAVPRPLLARDAPIGDETREILRTLGVVREAIEREPDSIGGYIVSMSHDASDLLEVLLLFKEAGLWSRRDGTVRCPIDIAPLFETVDDLDRAAAVVGSLLEDPIYAEHLAARGRFQEIMLGYSDSNKDGGYWAANWRLHRAQREIAELLTGAGVDFRFFHGRGGTVARGGGRAHRAILSAPAVTRNGRIRFTEQGEVISFRYSMPALARRHLEQVVGAMLVGSAPEGPGEGGPDDLDGLMDRLAQRSRACYRELIDDPAFWPWFLDRSPVRHIGELPIASRPVSRGGGSLAFENLRAIPWVFAWTQMRYNAPGWYGIGTAFEELVLSDEPTLERCREAYRARGMFAAFIDNAQQEMARARIGTGLWYSDPEDRSMHDRLADEFRRAERAVLAVTGQAELLDNNPVIQRSIRERNPETDVIHALQVELLRRFRDADEAGRETLKPLVLLSVNALAAAMQSTG